ncbi:hypothetical protein [Vulcanisaeta thermophila]|uniref:hypothetical protein n=1 Tax=Vulcanisaeta thermophila TaxID=867917 RepID=UPI000853042B|nr:hypothetical protein [Vulcanisaeta thermophila]
MSEPRPVFAEGVHVMSSDGSVWQTLVFEYVDDGGYYRELVRDRNALVNELRDIMRNMQGFLDQEIIRINGERCQARVIDVVLGFRGSWRRPYLEFYIRFGGRLRSGLNVYEDIYEEEVAEYDYEILWLFPEGFRVVDYEIAGEGQVLGGGNILRLLVRKGTRVGNYESIRFLAP